METIGLGEAVIRVIMDQRESNTEASYVEHLINAWQGVSITGPAIGAVELDDDGSPTAVAYFRVLTALNMEAALAPPERQLEHVRQAAETLIKLAEEATPDVEI